MRSLLLAPLGLLLLFCLTGCGGGNNTSGSATPSAQGRAVLTVRWPAVTRLIPNASNSIVVTVYRGTTSVTSQTLARPATGSTTTAIFSTLPVGNLSVTAAAFPSTDGTGVAQASATVPLVIVGGQTTNFSITMNSTIDHLDLTAPSSSVGIGNTLQFIATAKDSTGAVVLTSPSKLTWVSSVPTVATVSATGVVTGVSTGTTNISVTDTESGKGANTNVTAKAVGAINFSAPSVYTLSSNPSEVMTADFDGDGKIDIAVGTQTGVVILYGKGDGTFGAPQTAVTWSGGASPYSVADMNGDGKPDLVCTAGNQVLVLLNGGGRSFASPIAIPCGSGIGPLVTADFNGDGRQDIAVTVYDHPGSTSTDIFTFLNQGSGVFTQGTTVGNIWIITGLKAADLNGDGKADLLVSITTDIVGTSGSNIYFGDGAGHFNSGPSAGTATANVDQTTVADFSGDGIVDFAIANSNDGSVSVIPGKGSGTFGTPATYGVGPYPDHIIAADFDGDGRSDIVVENRDATHFTVMRNVNGLFPSTVQFPTTVNCGPIAVADFNGDGKPDVVASNTGGASIAVILNTTP